MHSDRNIKNIFILSFIVCLLFIIPSLASAVSDAAVHSSTQSVLAVQGKVKNFDQESQVLRLKTSKGNEMSVAIDVNTALVGYSSLQEIEKDQGVKIWYSLQADKKIAIKIERKIEVGC